LYHYRDWAERVHPDDLESVEAKRQRSMADHAPYEAEYRITRADGSLNWIASRGVFQYDSEGQPQHMLGIVMDITERKQAEEALKKSRAEAINEKNRLEAVMEALPVGVAITNARGGTIRSNRMFEQVWGGPHSAANSVSDYAAYQAWWADTGQPVQPDQWASAQAVQKGAAVVGQLLEIQGFDGVRRFVLNSGAPVLDVDGHVAGSAVAIQDVTELKRVEQALREAKEAAEAANVAKSRFLANMSHELRTPMNAILGMIDVALPKAIDPTVQDCLRTMKGSADLLLAFLNDLLDSAKIESGKLEMESAPFSLRRMLEQITQVLSVRANENGLCFSCRVPDETPDTVIGDRLRLQQVLLNLAGNAIKFTEHGDVEICVCAAVLPSPSGRGPGGEGSTGFASSAATHPHPSPLPAGEGTVEVEFAVRDTGIGIPPSDLERIFQPFAQADASVARRFAGTGLGLSICRNLVEMMGGRIWVESQVGKGSTFHFTVRLSLSEELPSEFEAPLAPAAAARTQLRILLVEDNPANQKVATYMLRDRGHLVEIASDGHQAVSLTEHNPYDAILMDVQMPGMDGLEATAAIRAREAEKGLGISDSGLEKTMQRGRGEPASPIPNLQSPIPSKRVPIIAMTAYALKGDAERCLKAGMDGYLSKPIAAREMIALVERLAEKTEDKRPEEKAEHRIASAGETVTERHTREKTRLDRAMDGPSPFNLDEAMARLGGNAGLFREMAKFFFLDGSKLLAEIQAAAGAGDAVAIEKNAHRLKGTVLYLGAEAATAAIARVETLARSGDLKGASEAIRSMETEVTRLAEALRLYGPAAQ
jgi:signal transduction histidine kinase/CheY-like chemotaxis protein/HPt (histidine-containing phosphotransfer) domain-containing protein